MRGLLISLLLCTAVAHAGDDKGKAKAFRAYYEEGMKRFNLGDYADAVANFKNGYLAKPDPVFLFNLGQAYRMMGDMASAAREYRAYLREVPAAPNRAAVEKFLADAEEELRRRSTIVPPTGTLPLPNEPAKVESTLPPPAVTPPAEPTPMVEPPPTVTKPEEPAPPVVDSPHSPPPPPEKIVHDAPEPPIAPAESPKPPPPKSRWWIWTAIAVVVVAGGAVALALTLSPKDAPVPSTTGGVYGVAF
jgi:hypothetical protein